MKLLVVDDSDVMRRMIERSVVTAGDVLRTATNGVEALEVAREFEPDAVTMDISMPEMDGLACIESLLRIRPHARILVVSALKDRPTAVEALRLGAQAFLLKPFTAAALTSEMRELFAD